MKIKSFEEVYLVLVKALLVIYTLDFIFDLQFRLEIDVTHSTNVRIASQLLNE